ncbi:hypothetical protein HNP84_009952 [Thermocatellispora tengchongensis]|uniref:Uncharacterized protein n=1 Tax=Thermocatellispora tengchongensis TaxID=1073253 RepID=A0A840PWD4_9ACTN|nr:hypothetical protein [Thermocatellispora tengchongensis]MBB5140185.1 hypothetical protein [Thermocatellispora tengchongensis]
MVRAIKSRPLEGELSLLKARLAELERRVRALAEVDLVLVRALEADSGADDRVQDARLARELLHSAELTDG